MKHKFVVGGVEYGGEILRGGVEYEIDINGGGDLRFGVAACGSVKFSAISPHPFSEGIEFTWLRKQIEEESFSAMGVFTVRSVTKRGVCYDIEATDGMSSFDVDAKQYLDAINYPTNHDILLRMICSKFGVPVQIRSMANSALVVSSSPYWDGATVRDIISMLAEASGCFAHFLPDGGMYFGGYRNVEIDFTKSHYSSPFIADYSVAPIDKVQIRATQGDIGTIVGSGQNAYIVEGNPMFAVAPAGSESSGAILLLNAISGIAYTPCEIPLFNDLGVRVGDAFTINGVPAVAMSYRCSPSGTVISCTGSPRRDVQSTAANRDVIALLGRTNELVRTSMLMSSRIADAEGKVSTIEQTANSISAIVGQQGIRITELSTELSGTVKFTNLTDGVTQISGSNIKTGTINAVDITGCTITSAGYVSSTTGLTPSTATLSASVLRFLSANSYGGTTIATISAADGMTLSCTESIFINGPGSFITLQNGMVGISVLNDIEIHRKGQLYVNIDSGNIYQYISMYL